MMIELYTDGAAIPNPGRGGAGFVLMAVHSDGTILKRLERGVYLGDRVTNNAAEISAVIEGLKALTKPAQTITVYTDSQYVVNVGNGDWGIKANNELWRELFGLIEDGKHQVTFKWVRGHDGNEFNEVAHNLANRAVWK
jgi:ribonuclease HI